MVDHLLSLHGGAHAVWVTDVPHKAFDLAANIRGQRVQPAAVPKGIVVAKRLDALALFDQFLGEMAADKAVGAGDQYGVCHKNLPLGAARRAPTCVSMCDK